MYKPKEEVAVKGYIRKITAGKLGDVEGLGDAASGLTYSVKDPRNNEIAKGTGNLNAFGAFDFKFTLPDNANLGYARIDLTTNSSIPAAATSINSRYRNFAGRSLRSRQRSNPRRRILSAARPICRSRQNITPAAALPTPKRTGP